MLAASEKLCFWDGSEKSKGSPHLDIVSPRLDIKENLSAL
jgi:hypothetical protein